jgi:hypothetical protein
MIGALCFGGATGGATIFTRPMIPDGDACGLDDTGGGEDDGALGVIGLIGETGCLLTPGGSVEWADFECGILPGRKLCT